LGFIRGEKKDKALVSITNITNQKEWLKEFSVQKRKVFESSPISLKSTYTLIISFKRAYSFQMSWEI